MHLVSCKFPFILNTKIQNSFHIFYFCITNIQYTWAAATMTSLATLCVSNYYIQTLFIFCFYFSFHGSIIHFWHRVLAKVHWYVYVDCFVWNEMQKKCLKWLPIITNRTLNFIFICGLFFFLLFAVITCKRKLSTVQCCWW